MEWPEGPKKRLQVAAERAERAETDLIAAIEYARAKGVYWKEIASLIGYSAASTPLRILLKVRAR